MEGRLYALCGLILILGSVDAQEENYYIYGTHPGVCPGIKYPDPEDCPKYPDGRRCYIDSQCYYEDKCCFDGCFRVCRRALIEKQGFCPEFPNPWPFYCDQKKNCRNDYCCSDNQKCCPHPCQHGKICVEPHIWAGQCVHMAVNESFNCEAQFPCNKFYICPFDM